MNFLTNYLHRLINYLQNDNKGIIVIEKEKIRIIESHI